MTRIVTDTGFASDDWKHGFLSIEGINAGGGACETSGIDITPDTDVNAYRACLLKAPVIRVSFASFADGRGFTIAKSLRLMGYEGRLRAGAGLIADQYAMARRAGFDEVEIDDALAERQPEDQWLFRADWRAYDHQSRLRG
ncbi:MAG TPA: oxidoreductase [Maritimibacter sp.]|nr:oxidoreductase [Maritimibacter sp.]